MAIGAGLEVVVRDAEPGHAADDDAGAGLSAAGAELVALDPDAGAA